MPRIKYIELIQKVDSGGHASVYLGVNLHTGFRVAVKELNEHLFRNAYVKNKFIEEANRYLYLDHPNIVKLEDLILMPQTGYLVMEFVEGSNLREYMQLQGPVPFEKALVLWKEALSALDYAHQKNMVHMDIKPSNIMLTEEGQVKLIDFGISQDANKIHQEYVLGTPYYMSPEQINGQRVDHRTDIYSFGVTMYELLTGSLPFTRTNSREALLEEVKQRKMPSLGSMSGISQDLLKKTDAVIEKATEKDPYKRYQDCGELMKDLDNLSEGLKAEASNYGRWSVSTRQERAELPQAKGDSFVKYQKIAMVLFVLIIFINPVVSYFKDLLNQVESFIKKEEYVPEEIYLKTELEQKTYDELNQLAKSTPLVNNLQNGDYLKTLDNVEVHVLVGNGRFEGMNRIIPRPNLKIKKTGTKIKEAKPTGSSQRKKNGISKKIERY